MCKQKGKRMDIEKINRKFKKNKLKDYNKLGYKVIFFIPLFARKFYKEFEGSIVSNMLGLKKFLMPL